MNVFFSDTDPVIAAQNLDSRRCIKMALESAQLLSNSLLLRDLEAPYNLSHEYHPATRAVIYNRANYDWLLKHFEALLNEYTFRYGKIHKCAEHLELFKNYPPLPIDKPLDFPNCTKFKNIKDVMLAYRMTLLDKWAKDIHKPKWSGPFGKRSPPNWALNTAWFTLYGNHELEND